MLGYKLLSCSLCKMGFSSSPAAAPPLPCWQCSGLALKLLWPWFVRVWWLEEGGAPLPLSAWPRWWLCAQTKTRGFQRAAASGDATHCPGAVPCQWRVQLIGWGMVSRFLGAAGAVHRQGGVQVLLHSLPARDKSYVRLQHPQRGSMWRTGKQRGKLRGR